MQQPELRSYHGLRRNDLLRWFVPALVGALLGGLYAASRPTVATSTAALYISAAKPEQGSDPSQLTNTVESRMYSYYNLTHSNTVLQPVIDTLKLDTTVNDLKASISASVPPDSMIIEVSAKTGNAEESVQLANAVRDSLGNAIRKMTPDQPGGLPAVAIFNFQDARDATTVRQASLLLYTMLGAAAGVALAMTLSASAGPRGLTRNQRGTVHAESGPANAKDPA